MLQLLAREASAERLEDVLRTAQRGGIDGEELNRLIQAKEYALGIRHLFARRQQREAALSALVDTARDLTSPYGLDALLKVITRRARLLLGLDMSWVSFLVPEENCSVVRAADGHVSAITVGFKVPLGGGVGRMARMATAPFWSASYLDDDSFEHSDVIDDVVSREGLQGIMAVPLQYDTEVFGSLYVADRNVRHFTPEDVALMTSLADLAAVAIERTRLLEQAKGEVTELEGRTARALDRSTVTRRLHTVHRELIESVLAGCDLNSLLAQAATELTGALLVRDVDGSVLAAHGQVPDQDAVAVAAAICEAHTGGAPVPCAGGLWVSSVTAGAEPLGALVLHLDRMPTEWQTQLLQLAAQAVGALLLVQRSTAIAEGQIRDELFNDLLNATGTPPRQLLERARRLSVDVTEPHVIVVARPEGGQHGRALVWSSSYAHRHSGLKCAEGGRIVLLLPGSDPEAAARAVSQELSGVLGHAVTVGTAGPVTSPLDIGQTYQQAQRCLDTLTALDGSGGVASARELGFLGLLLSDTQDIDGFIVSTIGPVLDYDSQQSTELVRTLDAYFSSGGSPTRAAEALFVHPNTVSRRLERITELLGESWQEPAQALEVQLALRLQRTRQQLRGGRVPGPRAHASAPME